MNRARGPLLTSECKSLMRISKSAPYCYLIYSCPFPQSSGERFLWGTIMWKPNVHVNFPWLSRSVIQPALSALGTRGRRCPESGWDARFTALRGIRASWLGEWQMWAAKPPAGLTTVRVPDTCSVRKAFDNAELFWGNSYYCCGRSPEAAGTKPCRAQGDILWGRGEHIKWEVTHHAK